MGHYRYHKLSESYSALVFVRDTSASKLLDFNLLKSVALACAMSKGWLNYFAKDSYTICELNESFKKTNQVS